MLQDGIVSTEWIYKNIFNFTEDEIKQMDTDIVFDFKQKFRRSQIENEGNDPDKSGQSQGTPADLAMGRTGHELDDEGGSPEGGWDGAGRPKEIPKYSKDGSARGRDPLGSNDKKRASKGIGNMALAHYDSMKDNLKKMGKNGVELISESEDLKKEYDKEVGSTKD
jgi:hypothetical protein